MKCYDPERYALSHTRSFWCPKKKCRCPVSWAFLLRQEAESSQRHVALNENMTMHNVEKVNNNINITSPRNYRKIEL
jgi:hypothetical protein